MFEREFTKAKNNIIKLLLNEVDESKLIYFKNVSKETIDSSLNIRLLIKDESSNPDIKRYKLAQFYYTKILLQEYLKANHTHLSKVEQQIFVSMALKKIFNMKSSPDKDIAIKRDILEYAKKSKTGLHYFSLSDCLNSQLQHVFKEDWEKIIEALNQSNNIEAQRIIIKSCLLDLAKYTDISDYIVRCNLIANAPVEDQEAIAELIHTCDISFLANNKVNEISGLSKIYELRDILGCITDERKDEVNNERYITEYHHVVKLFNQLQKNTQR